MLFLLFLNAATVEGITETWLSNGLRVLTLPDPSKATLTVNVTYLVGSRHEDYGETGMAHLLEHLLFKGTPTHPHIDKELTARGARSNGTTSHDRTNYYETLPASDDNLKWALGFEADRMLNSYIAQKDLDSEMTVVRNELENGENNPQRVLLQRTLATMFLWHNYGKSTIGARSDVEQVPIERLQAFYKKHYQPDNAVLMIAGRFDEKRALAWVNETFGKLPKPSRPKPKTYTIEPTQDGERTVTLRRTGDVQLLSIAYHVMSGGHEDFAAVDVLSLLLGATPYGRLHKALVETKKAARVSGFDMQLHDPGVIYFNAELRQGQSLDEARDIAVKTIESFGEQAPSQEDVDKARAEIMKQVEALTNAPDRLAIELSDWMGTADWRLFFLHRDRLQKVTPADVQRVAKWVLKSSNRTIGTFLPTPSPDRTELPEVKGLAEALLAYQGREAKQAGEAFDPSPANVEARTKRSATKSGLKLALLPKRTRNEQVSIALNLHFGTEQALFNRDVAASAVAPMLLRGSKRKTREQLKEALDKLQVRLSMNSSAVGLNLVAEMEKKNLAAGLALLGEILREPVFDGKELEQWRQERLASIEGQRSQPQALGTVAFQRHMKTWPQGHPLYVASIDESVAAVTALKLAEVKAFYDEFYGATTGELAVVGDFDEQVVTRFIGDHLASWQAKQPYRRIGEPFKAVPAKHIVIETPDKPNAFFMTGVPLPLADADADYPALLLGNYMLGGSGLGSRLATRIRQKEGLSYAVGSVVHASAFEKHGMFMSYAIYAPQNAARLEAAFKEELQRLLKEGVGDDELQSAKTGLLQSRDMQRAQDAALAMGLAGGLHTGRTFAFDAELEKKIATLDGKAVLAAMRQYIDPAALSAVKAGDFSESGKSKR